MIESHRPAVILNTTAFSAMREDDTTVLDVADAAVLQVVLAGSTRVPSPATGSTAFRTLINSPQHHDMQAETALILFITVVPLLL